MNALRAWIITIVSVTLLCTLIERFAPQGSLSKYVRLVCGLAVTVMIAMPVLSFFGSDFDLESVAWNEYTELSGGELRRRIEKLERKDLEQMLEVYRQSLISDIKSRYKGDGEFMVGEVDAVLVEDAEDETFGMIRALYLTLEARNGNNSAALKNETIDRIKVELSEVFAIDEEKIHIESSGFIKHPNTPVSTDGEKTDLNLNGG